MVKKFFMVVLFIIIAIFIIFVIFFLYNRAKMIGEGRSVFVPNQVSPTVPVNNVSNYVNEKIIIDDPDLNGLDGTFEKIRQATLDNNISLLNKYYSVKTIASFSSSGGGRIIKTHLKDVMFNNIRKVSSTKVLVTISQVEMSGHTEDQDIIFVRESNGWKMGVVETKEYFNR